MHRIFQRFIDRLSSAEDADGFSEAMAVAATALDLSCFGYLALPNRQGKRLLVISTYPASWVAHYLCGHYERLDPVIAQALRSPEPFRWGSDFGLCSRQISSAQHELLPSSEFGLALPFPFMTVTAPSPRSPSPLTNDGRSSKSASTCTHMSFNFMGMYFHSHVRRKLANEHGVDGIRLSPRELECLEWASQGKSAWEIGRILGISRNTVASYLENAKEKLGVRTVVQAATRLAAASKEKQN